MSRPGSSRSLSWEPPQYRVDEDGRVIGASNDQVPNNWGRWGPLDEIGTANLITPERIAAAAALVERGDVYSCALPLDASSPVHPNRVQPVHLYRYTGTDAVAGGALSRRQRKFQATDDYLFMPVQGSTQWDGLAHVASEDCLYNGFWVGNVESYLGAKRCSIHHMSTRLVGRGVLLDVARHRGQSRLPGGHGISGDQLDQCAQAQGVTVGPGDIVLVRTGHVPWYFELRDKAPFWQDGAPGLDLSTAEWAHGYDIGAIAVDNLAVEVEPVPGDHPYPLHVRLIRDLGLTLGEMWWLEDLADACAADSRYEFFLSAPPLKLTNGAGSMVNPVAIK